MLRHGAGLGVFLALAFGSGCAAIHVSPEDDARRASIVGYWHVELVDKSNGSTISRLTHRRDDGTWVRHTREFLQDGTIQSFEISGDWGLSHGVYQWRVQHIAEEPAPTKLRRLLFRYHVLSIDEKAFVYREQLSGAEPVTENRVDEQFRLP